MNNAALFLRELVKEAQVAQDDRTLQSSLVLGSPGMPTSDAAKLGDEALNARRDADASACVF